eukprot:5744105-Amphidinium_carterae.1
MSRGLFSLGRDYRSLVTPFFVAKKDHRIRLIFDCRRSNQFFEEPPNVHLFSGSGFGEVLLSEGGEERLWFSAFDVKNAFYQHRLPFHLRKFFCLWPLTFDELGLTSWQGQPVQGETKIYPQ